MKIINLEDSINEVEIIDDELPDPFSRVPSPLLPPLSLLDVSDLEMFSEMSFEFREFDDEHFKDDDCVTLDNIEIQASKIEDPSKGNAPGQEEILEMAVNKADVQHSTRLSELMKTVSLPTIALERKLNVPLYSSINSSKNTCWRKIIQFKCSFCNKECFWKHPMTRHEQKNCEPIIHECSLCKKTFTSKSRLKIHTRITHTGEKPLGCSFCKKTFSSKSRLEIHIRIVHTGEKPFKCSFCKKTFSSKSRLEIHIRIVHTGEKPFKCSFCKKSFSSKAILETHIRIIHTGEKPFKCSFCRQRFSLKTNLKNHQRIQHSEKPSSNRSFNNKTPFPKLTLELKLIRIDSSVSILPFKCYLCNKLCYTRDELENHLRIHKGERRFKCCFCNKTFPIKAKMEQHKATHGEMKRYMCSFCEKPFSNMFDVMTHEGIHHGQKSHVCSYCTQTFSTKSSLRVHTVKVHVGDKPHKCYCGEEFRKSNDLLYHLNVQHVKDKMYSKLIKS